MSNTGYDAGKVEQVTKGGTLDAGSELAKPTDLTFWDGASEDPLENRCEDGAWEAADREYSEGSKVIPVPRKK